MHKLKSLRIKFWNKGCVRNSVSSAPEPAKNHVTEFGNNGRGPTPREEKKMDIRVTSTDRIFYQVPTDIAALLIEAFPASFEKIEKAAPPTKKPGSLNFNLERAISTGDPVVRYQCAACAQGGVLFNSGITAQSAEKTARDFFFWHCGKKEVLPEQFINQFVKAFE